MSVATVTEQDWTGASIDTALVRINTALACLRRNPDAPVDDRTSRAVEDARWLKLHLEQNPSACTADGLACCNKLLEARGT
jgi:hypothetical protein